MQRIMRVDPQDIERAREYWKDQDYPRFSAEQLAEVRNRVRLAEARLAQSPRLHNVLGLLTLSFLFVADLAALAFAPSFWAVAALHGFLAYGIIVYSMHEGAAHGAIVKVPTRLSEREKALWRPLRAFSQNACRAFFADPIFYREKHALHHAYFATDKDGLFTNYFNPWRLALSLLPIYGGSKYNDFRIHNSSLPSPSRARSAAVGVLYLLICLSVMRGVGGFTWPQTLLAVVVVGPWISVSLDRLRETMEHDLMPLDTAHGTRELGADVWGLLLGGGPWGQPCHLSHHYGATLPWYEQLRLSREFYAIATPEQRQFYFVRGGVGFPPLFVSVMARSLKIYRQSKVRA